MEYAIEAINNAGTCVGILCTDGIVLAAERKTTSKLLAPSKSSDKIYQIDGHIACVVAGLTSDANILINQGKRREANGRRRSWVWVNAPLICARVLFGFCILSPLCVHVPVGAKSLNYHYHNYLTSHFSFFPPLPSLPPPFTPARLSAQRYLYQYQETMPVEQLVRAICDYKQAYTQYGGLRPFGVSFLFAGYDR